MIIIAIEDYIDLKALLIIKIIIRVYYIYHFILILLSSHIKVYYIELFTSSFCFISILIEFYFIKDFFDISDIVKFSEKPDESSQLFKVNILLTKLILQIFISGIICMIFKFYERNFITNFFENIKGRLVYCFYNKNYEMMKRIKEGENKEELLSSICKNINIHLQKCNVSECLCCHYKEGIKNDDIFNSNTFLKNLTFLLETNLRNNLKRNKHTNSETYTKFLMIDTLYALYFNKHYAKCFFNIEKIQRQIYFKKNFYLKVQIFWLKYEVIIDFIKFNKTSSLNTFRKMRENYEKYNKYKNLETSFLNILSDYKNLVTIFFSKNLDFTNYYFFLDNLYKSIYEGNKLIRYIMLNHDQHNSQHIRKIDYISKFLNGNNIFIPSHKIKQYLSLTEDDKSEKLIVKHTKKKEFLFDYISPKLAEQLKLKTNQIIGTDIHKFMSNQFIEFHYSHIVGHIKNNKLLIKNKEIYFIDKNGYCVNYYVDGSILITLNGEILVYLEVNPICEEYKQKNISFISCDEEGEIIALNKQFSNNFYIDIDVKNVVQPNLFKSILTVSKSKLNFKNDEIKINFPYEKFIKNIRSIDYSKLWDHNTNNYFKYLENLNVDKYLKMEKVNLEFCITKRNLQNKFYFYDLKIYIGFLSENKNKISSITVNPIIFMKNLELNNEYTKLIKPSIVTKKSTIDTKKNITKIKTLSILIRKWGMKSKIYEKNNNYEKVFEKLKDKLEENDLEKNEELKYKNGLLRMLLFILFILGFFLYLGDYTKGIFIQVALFSKIKLNIFILQQTNYYIINSIFSLNLKTGGIKPDTILLKNLNFSTNLDNSLFYHLNMLKYRRDKYQQAYYSFYNNYLNLDKYIVDNLHVFLNESINISKIDNDWKMISENSTISDILEYNYRGISKILTEYSIKESENSDSILDYDKYSKDINKYLFYNSNSKQFFYEFIKNNNETGNSLKSELSLSPSLRDKNFYYFLENSIIGFKNLYDSIKNDFEIFSDNLFFYYKLNLIGIFLSICIVVILFYFYEGIAFYYNYNKVIMKYFMLYDILKNYMDELYIKIEILEELFLDFTDSNRRKYSFLANDSDFMGKKISKSETLKQSFSDIKNKIISLSENKSLFSKSFITNNVKTSRLLDYLENKESETIIKSIFKTKKPTLIKKSVNLNKVITLPTININEFNINNELDVSLFPNINNMTKNSNKIAISEDNIYNIDYFKNDISFTNISKINKKDEEISINEITLLENSRNVKVKTNIKKDIKEIKSNKNSDKNVFNYDQNINEIEKNNLPNNNYLKVNINPNNNQIKTNKANTKVGNVTTNSTFNKTECNFLQNINTISNLNEDKKENGFEDEDQHSTSVKKSKKYYIMFSIFWMLLLLIISLVIVNIDNTGKNFEKIKTYTFHCKLFYERILILSEVIMIYQISVFKKDSNFLIENSKSYLNKIYSDYRENEKQILNLMNNQNTLSSELKNLENSINSKNNFCLFLSENIYQNTNMSNKQDFVTKYFKNCQQTSQNSFSIGFSKAAENLFNYMNVVNRDLINYFNEIKNNKSEFSNEKLKNFLNDFYYIFSFSNHDKIIYDLYEVLDLRIRNLFDNLLDELEEYSTFIFYFLYFLIILLGIFNIYKTKCLIRNSDKLINFTTDVIENGIKFSNYNE